MGGGAKFEGMQQALTETNHSGEGKPKSHLSSRKAIIFFLDLLRPHPHIINGHPLCLCPVPVWCSKLPQGVRVLSLQTN